MGVAIVVSCAAGVAHAVDLAAGDIVITDLNASSPGLITRIRAGSQAAITASPAILDPYGVAVSPLGNLYVTQRLPGPAGVYRVNPATGERITIVEGSPLEGPSGIAIDSAGDLIVADRTDATIFASWGTYRPVRWQRIVALLLARWNSDGCPRTPSWGQR